MIRILPALSGWVRCGVLRRGAGVTSETARSDVCSSDICSSDMDCLPRRYRRYQGKIQGESGAFARAALHADIPRVFLNDAVGYGEPKTGAAVLAFRGRSLGGEEGIVDAVYVFLRNARTGVRDPHADEFAVESGHVQNSAPGHGILGI